VVRNAAFAVPGDLAIPTGGYVYDRRIIAELSLRDWRIEVVDLGDGFPYPAAEPAPRPAHDLRRCRRVIRS